MALFAKNKPTKRVEFEGGYVELQFLSKGVKDEIQSRLTSMFADYDEETLKKLDFNKKDDIPANMINVFGKVQEIEYYKLSCAIKEWSENDVPINVDTVKELDDETFDKISQTVNEMNQLDKVQEKN